MNDKKIKPCGSEAGLEVMSSPRDQGPGVCGVGSARRHGGSRVLWLLGFLAC